MMLTCQFASQGFHSLLIAFCMSLHRSTSGSVDFQGAFLSKMFQVIRIFLQNCLIIFIVSHKALETLPVAAPAMLKFATKLCNLTFSVFWLQCYLYGGIDICSILSLFVFGGF